jgi:hypothetical protein
LHVYGFGAFRHTVVCTMHAGNTWNGALPLQTHGSHLSEPMAPQAMPDLSDSDFDEPSYGSTIVFSAVCLRACVSNVSLGALACAGIFRFE